jgi:hypothetical protein
MDTTESKDGEKACCTKGKCCGKALAALALLLIGGAGGYFCARHCGSKTEAAVSQPQAK